MTPICADENASVKSAQFADSNPAEQPAVLGLVYCAGVGDRKIDDRKMAGGGFIFLSSMFLSSSGPAIQVSAEARSMLREPVEQRR
jgi:hypothetical protein